MKKIALVFTVFASLAVCADSVAQGGAQGVVQADGIAVSGVRLVAGADSVVLEMTVAVSTHAVPALQGIELIPVLSASDGGEGDGEVGDGGGESIDGGGSGGERSIAFPAVIVNGADRARMYLRRIMLGFTDLGQTPPFRVITIGNDASDADATRVDYRVRMVREEWMEGARLSLVYVLVSPAGERHSYSSPVTGMSVPESCHPEPTEGDGEINCHPERAESE